jgi:hypothetical protein
VYVAQFSYVRILLAGKTYYVPLIREIVLQQDPSMANAMSALQDPNTRSAIEERMKAVEEDPELAPIMKELQEGGPGAMMK